MSFLLGKLKGFLANLLVFVTHILYIVLCDDALVNQTLGVDVQT